MKMSSIAIAGGDDISASTSASAVESKRPSWASAIASVS
jgi:hypothetical protein